MDGSLVDDAPGAEPEAASYVCPLCDGMLHATSEHALIAPEGDVSKRRHAHMDCVRRGAQARRVADPGRVAGRVSDAEPNRAANAAAKPSAVMRLAIRIMRPLSAVRSVLVS